MGMGIGVGRGQATGMSRNIAWVRNDLNVNRRPDFEPPDLAVVALEVKLEKPVIVIGYYRQHQVPGLSNSDSFHAQKARFTSLLSVLKKIKDKHEIIICSDTNIDTSNDCHSNSNIVSQLKEIWQDFLSVNDFTIMNDKDKTFFRQGTRPSLIDHVWTNCPLKLSNLTTRPHFLSPDHHNLTVTFQSKYKPPPPRR